MNILFVSPYIPYPLNNGGRIRSFNLIKKLSQEHNVTLTCLNKELPENEVVNVKENFLALGVKEIQIFRAEIYDFSFIFFVYPSFLLKKYFSKSLKRYVNQNIESFDAVIFDGLFSCSSLQSVITSKKEKAFFLCEHNVEFELIQQRKETASGIFSILLLLEALTIRRFEVAIAKSMNSVHCVSKVDAEKLKLFLPRQKIVVSPNGVNINDFEYKTPLNNKELIFVGSGQYWPNLDAINYFLKEIIPLLLSHTKEFKVKFVGRSLKLQSISEMKDCFQTNVEFYSDVAEVKSYVHSSSIFIVPLRFGSGTRIKVLEAMALGCPVISTSLGVDGIEGLQDGENILIANTPEQFVRAIDLLLGDYERMRKISLKARQLVEQHYSWDYTLRQLENELRCISDAKKNCDLNYNNS